MKKALYLGFAALAAFAFTACQKEAGVDASKKNMVTVTLTAEKAGDETRTAAVEEETKVSYEWTAEDVANLKVCVVGEDADAGIEAGKRGGMKTLSVNGAKGADYETNNLENFSIAKDVLCI